MKIVMILLAAMTMVVYKVSGSPATQEEVDACYAMTHPVLDLENLTVIELTRISELFSELSSAAKATSAGDCVIEVNFKSYEEVKKESNEHAECPRMTEEVFQNLSECKRVNVLRLECLVRRTSKHGKIIGTRFDEMSNCLKPLGDAPVVKEFLAQRTAVTFDKTIIDQIEDTLRKYKEQK